MKQTNKNQRGQLFTTLGFALGAMLVLPIACGDDDDPVAPAPGGKGGSGGTRDASAGTSGSSGRGGTAGSSGSAGASGNAGSAGSSGTAGTAGTAGTGGSSGTAGTAGTGGVTDGGDGGPSCGAPSDAGRARACLAFTPETIAFQSGDVQLDGQGVLIVLVYGTPTPGPTDQPIASPIQYPPPTDAGQSQVSVTALPVIPIDNLPATVYIRALFVDNPAWFGPPFNRQGLTYGMFVGGLNLNGGLEPTPPLREVTLALGAGTVVPVPMRALRKFSTQVALLTTDAGTIQPLDDGQGWLSVAAFHQSDPRNAFVYGGLRGPCVNMLTGAKPVAGLFFDDGDFWFGGQVDDYGLQTTNPEGALVSLVPVPSDAGVVMRIPDSQKVTVAPTQYSVTIPQITLTGTIPKPGTWQPFACPVPDAGPG